MRKAIAGAKDSPKLIVHYDSFAAECYDGDEYTLLGMAVKYAGLQGVNIEIISDRSIHEEAHLVDLQANVKFYLPEMFDRVRKAVADGKVRVLGLGHLSGITGSNHLLMLPKGAN